MSSGKKFNEQYEKVWRNYDAAIVYFETDCKLHAKGDVKKKLPSLKSRAVMN